MSSASRDLRRPVAAGLLVTLVVIGWAAVHRPRSPEPPGPALPLPAALGTMDLVDLPGTARRTLSDIPLTRLALLVSPDDCPSCLMGAVAEMNRLAEMVAWQGKILCCICGGQEEALGLLRSTRRRARLLFPVYCLADTRKDLRTRQTTPMLIMLDDSLHVTRTFTLTPSSMLPFASLVDSLWASGSAPTTR